MSETEEAPKVRIACEACGSERVTRDAWAEWDFDAQDWVLASVYDYAFCHDCEEDARLAEGLLDS